MKTDNSRPFAKLSGNAGQGFTMMETLAALAIAGILSAVAVAGFSGLAAKERVNRAAAELATDLIVARTSAIRENRNFMITLTGNNSYTVSCDNNNNGAFESNEIRQTRNLASLFRDVVVSGAAGMTLSPRGTATPVTLTFSNGRYLKSVSLSATGRIKTQ
jgi:type IV fimbrial biogenesis protein FimT